MLLWNKKDSLLYIRPYRKPLTKFWVRIFRIRLEDIPRECGDSRNKNGDGDDKEEDDDDDDDNDDDGDDDDYNDDMGGIEQHLATVKHNIFWTGWLDSEAWYKCAFGA